MDRPVEVNYRLAPTLLGLALAVVFVWFGALELLGSSPVHDLIAQTLPFVDADLAVPALGVAEVVIGLALAAGVLPRITLLVLCGHLAGTFLTFVAASELMWTSNPPELTADGEFVVKNLVLITAALVLIGCYSHRGRGGRGRSTDPVPTSAPAPGRVTAPTPRRADSRQTYRKSIWSRACSRRRSHCWAPARRASTPSSWSCSRPGRRPPRRSSSSSA